MTNDGGPAFAMGMETPFEYLHQPGMSLRDYFAAAAMQGDLSNEADEVLTWEDIAKRAYKMADAMLEERMKND